MYECVNKHDVVYIYILVINHTQKHLYGGVHVL